MHFTPPCAKPSGGRGNFQWIKRVVPGAGLVMDVALAVYGVQLPDLYVELILARKLTLRAPIQEYLAHDTPYPEEGEIVH